MKARIAGGIAASVLILATGSWLIAEEGVRTEAYPDPFHGWAIPTGCIGETGPRIQRGHKYRVEQCLSWLNDRLHRKWGNITDNCLHVEVPVHVALAVLSLADNVGEHKVCRSTLMAQINAGEPPEVYCEQFLRWVYSAGEKRQGLVNRRTRERAMCLGHERPEG